MWIKLTGVKAYTANGKTYAYDRLSKQSMREHVAEKDLPVKRNGEWHGNETFVLALAKVRAGQPVEGTVQALITAYKRNEVSVRGRKAFAALAERTREDYEKDLSRLTGAKIDDRMISGEPPESITVDIVRDLRDGWAAKHGATQTTRIMSACSVVWSYGLEYGEVTTNPWKAVKAPARDSRGERANRPWSVSEVLIMIETAPHDGLARAYALALMGIRPEQLPALTLREFRGLLKARKTGREHHIKIPDALRPLFEGIETSIMVTNGPDGLPWTKYAQLRRAFMSHRDRLLKAGDIGPGLTLKGLNHTFGAAMSDEGATEAQMSAGMARSRQTVRKYSDRGDTKRLSGVAFDLLSAWLTQSKNADKLSKGSDTT